MRRSLDLLQFHLLGASVAAPAAGLLVWYVAFLTWSGQLLNPVNLVGVPAVMASGAIGGVVLYHLAWRVLLLDEGIPRPAGRRRLPRADPRRAARWADRAGS